MTQFMKPQTYIGDLIFYVNEDGDEVMVSTEWLKSPLLRDALLAGDEVDLEYIWRRYGREGDAWLKAWSELEQYGRVAKSANLTLARDKQYGRLSADGYMDCTDWHYADSEIELWEQLVQSYGEEVLDDKGYVPVAVLKHFKVPQVERGDEYMISCPRCGARDDEALLEVMSVRLAVQDVRFCGEDLGFIPEESLLEGNPLSMEVACAACGAQDITTDELRAPETSEDLD